MFHKIDQLNGILSTCFVDNIFQIMLRRNMLLMSTYEALGGSLNCYLILS